MWRHGEPSRRQIADVEWSAAQSGSPIIAGSIAYIDCEIEAIHDGGDHDIVVGRVATEVMESKEPPVFFQGSLRHVQLIENCGRISSSHLGTVFLLRCSQNP